MREEKPSPIWLRLYALTVYLFLYTPILVLVLFSFNSSRRNSSWEGFTTSWYISLWHNESLMRALLNSLKVACLATFLSTVLGTMAALALSRHQFRGREAAGALAYLPMMVPEIVMGIALLTFFIKMGIQLSIATVILAHVAFSVGYVTVTVRTRLAGMKGNLEEAAADLGATPWQAFWLVTFPRILPGIMSGALLAFTLSFDDFVITFFTAGIGATTLPLAIYSMLKFGVTPEVNAISTIMLGFTICLLALWSRLESDPKSLGR